MASGAARYEKLLLDGQAFMARGQYASARNRFRDAAKLFPRDPRGHFLLGTVLLAEKDGSGARAALEVALRLAPDNVEVEANLGLALAECGDRIGARGLLERALRARPGDPGICVNLANVLIDLGEAQAALDLLAGLNGTVEVLLARGQALIELGRPAQALEEAQQALALEPNAPDIVNAKRIALQRLGRWREALTLAERLATMGDPTGEAYLSIATIQAGLGDIPGATATLDKAIAAAGGPNACPVPLLQMRAIRLFYVDGGAGDVAAQLHAAAGARIESVPAFDHFDNRRDPDKPLKIGFVSPDFRAHSVMSFLLGPLAAFDRSRVSIHLYANVRTPDRITARARELAQGYRDIFKVPAIEVAKTVRADGIDVLIDLAGHTADNRLDVFARRPAPVQMTWLGYPYSTGMRRIRWRLTDAIADPNDQSRRDYSERLMRLERFLCFTPREAIGPASARPPGPPVFGSFNNLDKYDDASLDLWARALTRTPGSRLIVRQPALRFAEVRETWILRFAARGIESDRLDLAPFDDSRPNAQFTIHDQVDLCLDPLGYNGTTTTCQALWMGVPVIVTPGRAHAARVGASIMAAAGLPEFVACDEADAAEKIVALAQDRARLAEYRRTLRSRLQASPLCDAAGFARDFEDKLRFAWREYCAKA